MNPNQPAGLNDTLAVYGAHSLSTADAAAINEIAYAIYDVVPHGKNDTLFFSIDNIQVYEDHNSKKLKVALLPESDDLGDVLPHAENSFKNLKSANMTAFFADDPAHSIKPPVNDQNPLLQALDGKLEAEPEFAAEFQEHLKVLMSLQKRGFSLENYTFHPASNHGALTLWHEPSDTAVFAHRGSAGDKVGLIKDWLKTDFGEIGLLGKGLTKADEAAIGYVNYQFDRVVRKHPGIKNIFETGHSKGGRESQNAALFLESKLNSYIALREIAFEEKLTKVPPPQKIGLTSLTFNSARIHKGVSRMKLLGEKFSNSGFILRNLLGKPLLYLDKLRAEGFKQKMASLKPVDKNLMAASVAQVYGKVLQRLKDKAQEAPVQVKHINISYADIDGKNADPVSNLSYGGGHLGRDIVIKHPNVKPTFTPTSPVTAHSLKRTHELVDQTFSNNGQNTFNKVFADTSVNLLIDAVSAIPTQEYQAKLKTFTVAEINSHCIELHSKFDNQARGLVDVSTGIDLTQMDTFERIKYLRDLKQAANQNANTNVNEVKPEVRSSNDFGMG